MPQRRLSSQPAFHAGRRCVGTSDNVIEDDFTSTPDSRIWDFSPIRLGAAKTARESAKSPLLLCMTLTRAQQAASQFESSRGSHTLIFDFRFTIFDLSILRGYVLLVAALAKKILKDRCAFILEDAGSDFAMVIQARMLE